jgi:hypothetical protein
MTEGQRVMDLEAQGTVYYPNVDIAALVGSNTPKDFTFNVTVTNNNLQLVNRAMSGYGPMMSALQITQSPAPVLGPLVSANLSGVRVYPNPWRSDKHAGKPITFENLTVNSTVKLFTVSGHWIKTLPISSSSVTWDLTNDSNNTVSSGIYLYLITAPGSQKKTGQLAIIK